MKSFFRKVEAATHKDKAGTGLSGSLKQKAEAFASSVISRTGGGTVEDAMVSIRWLADGRYSGLKDLAKLSKARNDAVERLPEQEALYHPSVHEFAHHIWGKYDRKNRIYQRALKYTKTRADFKRSELEISTPAPTTGTSRNQTSQLLMALSVVLGVTGVGLSLTQKASSANNGATKKKKKK
jgi:hypothetical protein